MLRPQAIEALAGVDRILHAGDVGARQILEALEAIAPTTAVRGNVDTGRLALELPETAVVEVGGAILYMLHDVGALDCDPKAAGFAAVISGHSHQPRIDRRDGVLFLNPGSAGPRRFSLPVSLARIRILDGRLDAELVTLEL